MLAVKIGAGLLALLLLAQIVARRVQRELMYFPDPARVSPQTLGLDVEEIELAAPDGAVVLAWYGKPQPEKPVILYFHGNAGSLATRAERIRKYTARGYGVFMMTYRGFGGSTGTPSEAANVSDAQRAYDRLRALGIGSDHIVLYGESLGSGVAVQVAAAKPVRGLILDAPYTSMLDMARLHYPLLPSDFFLTDTYHSDRFIGRVAAPVLIVHGEMDDVIPVAMGRRLFDLAASPKEIVTLPGAGHSDHHLFGSYEAIYAWLERLEAGRAGGKPLPP